MRRFRLDVKTTLVSALLALALIDHLFGFGARAAHPDYEGVTATVTRVLDGDTIEISIPDRAGRPTRVRLRGIDAPEVAHHPGETDAHFGTESSRFLQQLIEGRAVRIALDPHRPSHDRYDRLLAYVILDDADATLNELLVSEGMAYADARFPHVLSMRFDQSERRAIRENRGLWANVTPASMPAWRQHLNQRATKKPAGAIPPALIERDW